MSANSHINKHNTSYQDLESVEKEAFLKQDERSRVIRYITATLSSITALIYFAIGFNILIVLQAADSQMFGLFAGVAYAFGALMLLTLRDRTLWIIGAILQVFVIYTYFSLAPQRIPEFEVWGLALRVMQGLILAGLLYLIVRAPRKRKAID